MAGKSVTSAGSCSGALLQHGIRAAGDGENMGGHDTIPLRGEIWGRAGRKVGVSGVGVSRRKG